MCQNLPDPSWVIQSAAICNKLKATQNVQRPAESSPLPLPVMNWAADDEPAGQHVHWHDKPTLNVGVMNQSDSNGLPLPSIDWASPVDRY